MQRKTAIRFLAEQRERQEIANCPLLLVLIFARFPYNPERVSLPSLLLTSPRLLNSEQVSAREFQTWMRLFLHHCSLLGYQVDSSNVLLPCVPVCDAKSRQFHAVLAG